MAIIKKNLSVGEDVEKGSPRALLGMWVQLLWKAVQRFLRKTKNKIAKWSSKSTAGYVIEQNKKH